MYACWLICTTVTHWPAATGCSPFPFQASSAVIRGCDFDDGPATGCSGGSAGGLTYRTCYCRSSLCNGGELYSTTSSPLLTQQPAVAGLLACFQCNTTTDSTCTYPSITVGTSLCYGTSCFTTTGASAYNSWRVAYSQIIDDLAFLFVCMGTSKTGWCERLDTPKCQTEPLTWLLA